MCVCVFCGMLVVKTAFLLFVCFLFPKAKRAFECGGQAHYIAASGEIVSHLGFNEGRVYGKNMDCIWTIEAPPGQMVVLYEEEFDLEGDLTGYISFQNNMNIRMIVGCSGTVIYALL